MILGLDFSDPVVLVLTIVLVFLAADLIAAGGCITGGMMNGMAGMMGTPWGWVLTVILAVLAIMLIVSGT